MTSGGRARRTSGSGSAPAGCRRAWYRKMAIPIVTGSATPASAPGDGTTHGSSSRAKCPTQASTRARGRLVAPQTSHNSCNRASPEDRAAGRGPRTRLRRTAGREEQPDDAEDVGDGARQPRQRGPGRGGLAEAVHVTGRPDQEQAPLPVRPSRIQRRQRRRQGVTVGHQVGDQDQPQEEEHPGACSELVGHHPGTARTGCLGGSRNSTERRCRARPGASRSARWPSASAPGAPTAHRPRWPRAAATASMPPVWSRGDRSRMAPGNCSRTGRDT